jgi:hypothetical protein
MPSRPIVIAVLGFWLAANGWLFYREIWPRLRTGEAPAYSIDLADEVRAEPISWEVLYNRKRIGTAITKVVYAGESKTYDLLCDYTYEKEGLPIMALLWVKKMSSALRVTRLGQLRQARVNVALRGWTGPAEMKLEADIDRGLLTPRLELRAGAGLIEHKLNDLKPVEVSEGGNILNPMHPLNKVTNLRDGQNWRLPDVDPLKTATAALVKQSTGQDFSFPALFAEVRATTLVWADRAVDCWLIEYHEAGKKVTARTWVRKADSLVLQQEAVRPGTHLVLRRELPK